MKTDMQSASIKIKAFLGTWGCQSGLLEGYELIDVAKKTFDVPGRTLAEVAISIDRLGRTERRARAREAIRKYWPEPSWLWPAAAPIRKSLAKAEAA